MSFPRPDDDERLPASWGEAWRADEASQSEVLGAYLRFSRRRRAAAPAAFVQIARWVLVGVSIGAGSVYAATAVPRLLQGAPAVAPALSAAPAPPASPPEKRGVVHEVAAPSMPEPPVVERAQPAPPTGSAVVSERWQRAARGLRGEDFESAHAALDELAHDGDRAQRESARLVQAQLFISQGQAERARTLLEELRSSARSVLVQQKAAKLLQQIDAAPPSTRSF